MADNKIKAISSLLNEQNQMIDWVDNKRGLPNAVLRSCLFGVTKRGERKFVKNQEIAAQKGIRFVYTGQRLDQVDLEVWEEILHRSKYIENEQIQFGSFDVSTNHFLKSIGRSAGGSDVIWLQECFKRLQGAVVEIKAGKFWFSGQLVHNIYRDETTGMINIQVNPELANLYAPNGWTLIETEIRKKLKGHFLAQWLWLFFSTHKNPFPYGVETIWSLCGSENAELKGFKQELKKALIKLEEATEWSCKIDKNNNVNVQKGLFSTIDSTIETDKIIKDDLNLIDIKKD